MAAKETKACAKAGYPTVPAGLGLGTGVPLSQPALGFEPDGRAWPRRGRTDASFSCPPRRLPQICVQGGYSIFPNWVMLRVRIPRHTHAYIHTHSLTHTHHAHDGSARRITRRNLIPSLPFSSLVCAGHLVPWTHVRVCGPEPHLRSAESSEMRMCVYCKPATLTEP